MAHYIFFCTEQSGPAEEREREREREMYYKMKTMSTKNSNSASNRQRVMLSISMHGTIPDDDNADASTLKVLTSLKSKASIIEENMRQKKQKKKKNGLSVSMHATIPDSSSNRNGQVVNYANSSRPTSALRRRQSFYAVSSSMGANCSDMQPYKGRTSTACRRHSISSSSYGNTNINIVAHTQNDVRPDLQRCWSAHISSVTPQDGCPKIPSRTMDLSRGLDSNGSTKENVTARFEKEPYILKDVVDSQKTTYTQKKKAQRRMSLPAVGTTTKLVLPSLVEASSSSHYCSSQQTNTKPRPAKLVDDDDALYESEARREFYESNTSCTDTARQGPKQSRLAEKRHVQRRRMSAPFQTSTTNPAVEGGRRKGDCLSATVHGHETGSQRTESKDFKKKQDIQRRMSLQMGGGSQSISNKWNHHQESDDELKYIPSKFESTSPQKKDKSTMKDETVMKKNRRPSTSSCSTCSTATNSSSQPDGDDDPLHNNDHNKKKWKKAKSILSSESSSGNRKLKKKKSLKIKKAAVLLKKNDDASADGVATTNIKTGRRKSIGSISGLSKNVAPIKSKQKADGQSKPMVASAGPNKDEKTQQKKKRRNSWGIFSSYASADEVASTNITGRKTSLGSISGLSKNVAPIKSKQKTLSAVDGQSKPMVASAGPNKDEKTQKKKKKRRNSWGIFSSYR